MNEAEQRLRALGLPDSVVWLATELHSDDMFFFRCGELQAPEALTFPEGLAAEPLWQFEWWVTAVRLKEGRLEYLGFDANDPEVWQVLAYTEQGLLANLFSDLVEDEDWDEEEEEALRGLREAAEQVGFQHLDALLAFQREHAEDEDYADTLAEWTRTL
jgi:hypothetical protein